MSACARALLHSLSGTSFDLDVDAAWRFPARRSCANSPAGALGSSRRLTGRSGCRQGLQWRSPQSGSGIGVPGGGPGAPNAQDAVGAGLVEAGDPAHLGQQ